jgi:drug/metabolite transporter (DMT)-like permease
MNKFANAPLDAPTLKPSTYTDGQPTIVHWSLILLLSMLWGSSFILMKFGLEAFTFTQVASWRLFLAFLVLSLFWLRISFKAITLNDWKYILVVALFGSGIPPFLFTLAQTHIPSAIAGVLNALTPLGTIFIGALFFSNRFNNNQIAGVVVGLLGAVLIMFLRADGNFEGNYLYSLPIVFACLCYGIGANTIKNKLQHLSPITITTAAFTLIGPPAGIYLWYSGAFTQVATDTASQQALGYLTILGVLGTAFALLMFNYLIKSVSALFASTVTYLMPIVSIGWGYYFGEALSWVHGVGMALILAGVWLTGRKKA